MLIKPDQDEGVVSGNAVPTYRCVGNERVSESQGRLTFPGLEKRLLELLCSSQKWIGDADPVRAQEPEELCLSPICVWGSPAVWGYGAWLGGGWREARFRKVLWKKVSR